MRRTKLLLLILIPFVSASIYAQKAFTVKSPSEKLQVNILVGETIEYSIVHEQDVMIEPSAISMELSDGRVWGVNSKLKKNAKRAVSEKIPSPIYRKAVIDDIYNELKLSFTDFDLLFRAYDEGISYRFVATTKKPFKVKSEQATFICSDDAKAHIPYVKQNTETLESQLFNSFENIYTYSTLADWNMERLAFLPLLIERANGKKVVVAESDLLNYPGMFLYKDIKGLKGVFAAVPDRVEQGGHNKLQGLVKSRHDYIAEFSGATEFPWRIIAVSDDDAQLANNDIVYKLASPSKIADTSWIKPGKVAWEWWNNWNIRGVDFESGVNTDTYKYYIDFASKSGIEYVILDEGWAVKYKNNLLDVVPTLDLPALAKYAKERNVDLILWAGYLAFEKDMEAVCKHYSEMGIKGFKVDFMDRDDQLMVDFHHRGAQIAAKYNMLLDYHGTYKPTGLQRTYPNVINFEGVHGLEQMKWSKDSEYQVVYDVTVPFIRQLAGPIDYTQGAMRNASKGNFRAVNSEPMSHGTRCRQLSQYVIFESPLNMLCDSPDNYMDEAESLDFIANIPTVWDETRVLNGEVGKYIVTARRSGDTWYVGAMTDWDQRVLNIDLSFLGEGQYKAEIFKDGVNAHRIGKDYKREVIDVSKDMGLEIRLAAAGGAAIKIKMFEK